MISFGIKLNSAFFSYHLVEAAKLLWNNMLEPVGHKAATQAEFKRDLICPSSSTSTLFFRTSKNSK